MPNGNENERQHPFLLIPMSPEDKGVRQEQESFQLGPDCDSIWIEEYSPDGLQTNRVHQVTAGGEYQIAVTVRNLGNVPSFSLCIDFLEWVRTEVTPGRRINYYSFVAIASDQLRQTMLLDGEEYTFRSTLWRPTIPPTVNSGDIIIRIYDPMGDFYTNYGDTLFRILNDRHLAHRSFVIA